jgi:6-phosphogluconolactonase
MGFTIRLLFGRDYTVADREYGRSRYFANEQGNSVSAYKMDPTTGLLTHSETIPTVPDDFCATSHCAEIKISPDGRWLVAPNRALLATGCCSVAVFAVDAAGGGLKLSEICLINDVADEFSPQHVAFSPCGQHCYVGDAATICQFHFDPNHGKLLRVKDYTCGGSDGNQTGGFQIIDLAGACL